MPLPPRPKLIKEKDGTRGLVPVGPDSRKDVEYTKYLEALDLGNNGPLRQAFAASNDIRFREFFRYISSPKNRCSITYWAKACGIDLLEMMNWVGKASNARALSQAQAAGPKIVDHMAEDAASRFVACERCDGLGFVNADEGLPMETPGYRVLRFVKIKSKDEEGNITEEEAPVWIRDCPMGCDRGRVRKPGDEFSREKLLEMAGHINKRGPGISNINNLGGQAMPSAVGRLDAMTIDIEPERNPNN